MRFIDAIDRLFPGTDGARMRSMMEHPDQMDVLAKELLPDQRARLEGVLLGKLNRFSRRNSASNVSPAETQRLASLRRLYKALTDVGHVGSF
jgi:hypothetical protein